MRKINKIIIHCSATPVSRKVSVDEIREWHIQRGFKDIGYHFIIHQNGDVEIGRPISEIGAHCKGYNRDSIGICYIGGVDDDGVPCDTRTFAQCHSLDFLIRILLLFFPNTTIHGHNEFSKNKSCPCFNVSRFYSKMYVNSFLIGGVSHE